MPKRTYDVQKGEAARRDSSYGSFLCALLIFLIFCVIVIIAGNWNSITGKTQKKNLHHNDEDTESVDHQRGHGEDFFAKIRESTTSPPVTTSTTRTTPHSFRTKIFDDFHKNRTKIMKTDDETTTRSYLSSSEEPKIFVNASRQKDNSEERTTPKNLATNITEKEYKVVTISFEKPVHSRIEGNESATVESSTKTDQITETYQKSTGKIKHFETTTRSEYEHKAHTLINQHINTQTKPIPSEEDGPVTVNYQEVDRKEEADGDTPDPYVFVGSKVATISNKNVSQYNETPDPYGFVTSATISNEDEDTPDPYVFVGSKVGTISRKNSSEATTETVDGTKLVSKQDNNSIHSNENRKIYEDPRKILTNSTEKPLTSNDLNRYNNQINSTITFNESDDSYVNVASTIRTTTKNIVDGNNKESTQATSSFPTSATSVKNIIGPSAVAYVKYLSLKTSSTPLHAIEDGHQPTTEPNIKNGIHSSTKGLNKYTSTSSTAKSVGVHADDRKYKFEKASKTPVDDYDEMEGSGSSDDYQLFVGSTTTTEDDLSFEESSPTEDNSVTAAVQFKKINVSSSSTKKEIENGEGSNTRATVTDVVTTARSTTLIHEDYSKGVSVEGETVRSTTKINKVNDVEDANIDYSKIVAFQKGESTTNKAYSRYDDLNDDLKENSTEIYKDYSKIVGTNVESAESTTKINKDYSKVDDLDESSLNISKDYSKIVAIQSGTSTTTKAYSKYDDVSESSTKIGKDFSRIAATDIKTTESTTNVNKVLLNVDGVEESSTKIYKDYSKIVGENAERAESLTKINKDYSKVNDLEENSSKIIKDYSKIVAIQSGTSTTTKAYSIDDDVNESSTKIGKGFSKIVATDIKGTESTTKINKDYSKVDDLEENSAKISKYYSKIISVQSGTSTTTKAHSKDDDVNESSADIGKDYLKIVATDIEATESTTNVYKAHSKVESSTKFIEDYSKISNIGRTESTTKINKDYSGVADVNLESTTRKFGENNSIASRVENGTKSSIVDEEKDPAITEKVIYSKDKLPKLNIHSQVIASSSEKPEVTISKTTTLVNIKNSDFHHEIGMENPPTTPEEPLIESSIKNQENTYITPSTINKLLSKTTKVYSNQPNISTCTTSVCKSVSSKMLSLLDDSVDPCEDFYSYACGQGGSRTSELNAWEIILKETLRIDKASPSHLIKFRAFFNSCVDFHYSFGHKDRINQVKAVLKNFKIDTFESADSLDLTDVFSKLLTFNSLHFLELGLGIDKQSSNYILQLGLSLDGPIKTETWSSLSANRRKCLEQSKQEAFGPHSILWDTYESYSDCVKENTEFLELLQDAIEIFDYKHSEEVDVHYIRAKMEKLLASATTKPEIREALVNQNYTALKVSDLHLNYPSVELSRFILNNPPREFDSYSTYTVQSGEVNVHYFKAIIDKLLMSYPTRSEIQEAIVNKNYTVLKISDLQQNYPFVEWSRLLSNVTNHQFRNSDTVQVYFMRYLNAWHKTFSQVKEKKWLLISLLVTDLYYNFVVHRETGQTEDYCMKTTASMFPDITSTLYLRNFQPNELKLQENRVTEVFAALKKAFNKALANYTDATSALMKLQKISVKLSTEKEVATVKALDEKYESLKPTYSYQEFFLGVKEFKMQTLFSDSKYTFGKLVNTFDTEAVTFYEKDIIYVPLGMVVDVPLDVPKHISLTKIGLRLGRALGKHFDPVGVHYRMSVPENFYNSFIESANNMLVKIYSNTLSWRFRARAVDQFKETGTNLTINQRMSDNIALRLLTDVFPQWSDTVMPWISTDNSKERVMMISVAQDFCEKRSHFDEVVRLQESSNLPGSFRVYNMFMNSQRFAEVFQCAQGSAMNENPLKSQFPHALFQDDENNDINEEAAYVDES